jgi:hypothetical protein
VDPRLLHNFCDLQRLVVDRLASEPVQFFVVDFTVHPSPATFYGAPRWTTTYPDLDAALLGPDGAHLLDWALGLELLEAVWVGPLGPSPDAVHRLNLRPLSVPEGEEGGGWNLPMGSALPPPPWRCRAVVAVRTPWGRDNRLLERQLQQRLRLLSDYATRHQSLTGRYRLGPPLDNPWTAIEPLVVSGRLIALYASGAYVDPRALVCELAYAVHCRHGSPGYLLLADAAHGFFVTSRPLDPKKGTDRSGLPLALLQPLAGLDRRRLGRLRPPAGAAAGAAHLRFLLDAALRLDHLFYEDRWLHRHPLDRALGLRTPLPPHRPGGPGLSWWAVGPAPRWPIGYDWGYPYVGLDPSTFRLQMAAGGPAVFREPLEGELRDRYGPWPAGPCLPLDRLLADPRPLLDRLRLALPLHFHGADSLVDRLLADHWDGLAAAVGRRPDRLLPGPADPLPGGPDWPHLHPLDPLAASPYKEAVLGEPDLYAHEDQPPRLALERWERTAPFRREPVGLPWAGRPAVLFHRPLGVRGENIWLEDSWPGDRYGWSYLGGWTEPPTVPFENRLPGAVPAVRWVDNGGFWSSQVFSPVLT